MSTHRLTAGRYTGPMTNAGAARAIAHYLRTVHATNPATMSAASTLDEMARRIEADEGRYSATRRELDAVAIDAAAEESGWVPRLIIAPNGGLQTPSIAIKMADKLLELMAACPVVPA